MRVNINTYRMFIILLFLLFAPYVKAVTTITSPTVHDCQSGNSSGITVKNTHDVTVRNCNINISSGNGIQITDSYNITIENISINSSDPEGSGINIESTGDGLTHDVTVSGFTISGPMGWGIAGSYKILKHIVIKDGLIKDIGQSGGQQKHGMYVENWQGNSMIENVTISRSWDTGLKIVGATQDMVISGNNIQYQGRNGSTSYPTSGAGVTLGDGRSSDNIKNITFTNNIIANNTAPAIWTLQKTKPLSNIKLDHNTFYNNYYAVELDSGANGWTVTNNIGLNDSQWKASKVPLQLDGNVSDISRNTINHNLWYFKSGSGVSSPVKVGGSSYSLSGWQALQGSPGSGSLSVDPKFVNASAGDFHLQSGSPACSSGTGGTYIGAYPCGASSGNLPVPTSTMASSITSTPRPTNTPYVQVSPTVYPGLSWWSVNLDLASSEGRSYKFSLEKNGNYVVKALVNASVDGNNSFIINIDAVPQDPENIWDIMPLTNGFEMRTLSHRGNGTYEQNQFNPKVFYLSSGIHTLYIVGREPGTQIQQIKLESYGAKVAGDADGNSKVDGIDYIVWLNHYNQNVAGIANGDFDGNNGVDGIDYIIWLNNYGN